MVPTDTPDADWDAGAYFVGPSGDVDYVDDDGVSYSYGHNSPGTTYPNFSRILNTNGVVEYGFDDNGAYVDDSYGSPVTSNFDGAYRVRLDGDVVSEYYYVYGSYGKYFI